MLSKRLLGNIFTVEKFKQEKKKPIFIYQAIKNHKMKQVKLVVLQNVSLEIATFKYTRTIF